MTHSLQQKLTVRTCLWKPCRWSLSGAVFARGGSSCPPLLPSCLSASMPVTNVFKCQGGPTARNEGGLSRARWCYREGSYKTYKTRRGGP